MTHTLRSLLMKTFDWPSEPPTREGDGIRLRAWAANDAAAVFDACQDVSLQRWTTIPVPYLREHADEYVTKTAPEQWATRTAALFCVASSDDDRVLGACGLVTVDMVDAVAEAGYWVAPEAQGAKVAQRAMGLLTSWALGDGGMHRLELYIEPDNVASCVVAERVGFAREGVLQDKTVVRGSRIDLALYALVK